MHFCLTVLDVDEGGVSETEVCLVVDLKGLGWITVGRKQNEDPVITFGILAMKEGRNSPYTHPEDYTDNWTPLKKLQPVD